MYKMKITTVLIFTVFILLENTYSQSTLKCNYNWDLLENENVIVPIEDLFSSSDSNAILNTECLEPLIEKIKYAKEKGMYLSYTFYNETSKFKKINLYFYRKLYEYFYLQGIDENDIFSRFNSPLELPPPIIDGEFISIDEEKDIDNKSYLSFSLEVNKE
jgi:hypothetical protein